MVGRTRSISHRAGNTQGVTVIWHCGKNTKPPLLPDTPSSLPRCQEGVPDGYSGGARLSWGW